MRKAMEKIWVLENDGPVSRCATGKARDPAVDMR